MDYRFPKISQIKSNGRVFSVEFVTMNPFPLIQGEYLQLLTVSYDKTIVK